MRLPKLVSSAALASLAVAAGSLAWAQDRVPTEGEKAAKPETPGTVATVATAAKLPAAELGEAITDAIRTLTTQSSPAICRIVGDDEQGRLAGTGFLVDSEGTILTNYSLGEATEEFIVSVGEEKYPGRRILTDSRSGIALIKIECSEPLPFLKFGKAAELAIGTPVLALGFPMELPLSPSFGVVAGFDSGFQGRYFATRHIRANAAIQRGEGGAPLLNLKGEVVGVLISTVDGGSGLFALPSEAAEKILSDYRAFGRIRQGWLGADVRISDAPEHGSTARLRALRAEGPGAKGHLRPGDVLLQIGSWKIQTPEDVLNASFYITAGQPLPIRVSRAGKIQTLTITPTDAPEGEVAKVLRKESPISGTASDFKLGE